MDDKAIEVFAAEIIRQILRKISERSEIIRLKQVSKAWAQECEIVLKSLEWKSYCKKNIDEGALSSVLSSTFLKKQIKDFYSLSEQASWKTVFDCCRNWHILYDSKLYILSTNSTWSQNFRNEDEIITCLDIWSSYIAVGSNQGTVLIFDTNSMMSPLAMIPSPKDYVKAVKFWYTEHGKLLLIRLYTKSSQGTLKFWDVDRKMEVHTLKRNLSVHALCVGSANYFYGTAALYFFKCTPSAHNKELMTAFYYISMQDSQSVRAMASFGSTTYVLITGRSSIQLFTVKDTFDMRKRNSLELPVPRRLPSLSETINHKTQFYVFYDETIICVGRNLLYFNIKNAKSWISHNIELAFHSKVTSVLYHADLLLIGLDQGKLYMYSVNNSRELGLFDFLKKNSPRVIDFQCNAPIIDLAASQIDEDSIIVAASEKKLWRISASEVELSIYETVRIDRLNYFYE